MDSGVPPATLEKARRHLALALDVSSHAAATELVTELRPYFSVAKVGLELFVAEGPPVVRALSSLGAEIFLDLKLHDIPNTVGRAAERAGALGVRFLTVHTAGGPAMLAAAVEGFAAGRTGSGERAGVLGITVLTSDADAPADLVAARAAMAAEAGCVGVVCAASDLETVRGLRTGLLTVVPGIRLSGTNAHDQARLATPGGAAALGADLLVVGRTVTAAADRAGAAREVAAEVGAALGAGS